MFRIRKVTDDIYPMNKHALEQVMDILRQRFSGVGEDKIKILPDQLRNPLKYQFKSILLVADNFNGNVRGFALLFYAPDLDFCFLDYIATRHEQITSGVGGALYERCREEAISLNCCGIFMECLPDDPSLCIEESNSSQNAIRLRFYERFGARPIINTLYETPVLPDDTCAPFLVFDPLDKSVFPTGEKVRKIVNAILSRKYADYCPNDYVNKVVSSFADGPIELREYRYVKAPRVNQSIVPKDQQNGKNSTEKKRHGIKPGKKRIFLTINEEHSIHHVKEVGYVEAPVRISIILNHLQGSGMFETIPIEKFPDSHIRAVHRKDLVDFLKKSEVNFPSGNSVYPYVFPIRNTKRRPKDISVLPGYFCIDTFTPIHHNVWKAASGAVDCALSLANKLISDGGLAYALVRPPGHHAESNVFGGFCYLNSAAVAASYLAKLGKVAILDIDYHHGNGQQEIFYHRKDVLTVSIHGNPSTTYPYFSGFKNEKGEGEGFGFNHNFPLSEGLKADDYRKVLADAMQLIRNFNPLYLIVCLGLDTAKGDPTGTFSFGPKDFETNGKMIGSLKFPTLVIQEGGYLNRTLGLNALSFFKGLHQSFYPRS